MPLKYRYNRQCSFMPCASWMRDGDVFCGPHYWSLPDHLRKGLWAKDLHAFEAAVNSAKQWLQDKQDNALIVKEEGP